MCYNELESVDLEMMAWLQYVYNSVFLKGFKLAWKGSLLSLCLLWEIEVRCNSVARCAGVPTVVLRWHEVTVIWNGCRCGCYRHGQGRSTASVWEGGVVMFSLCVWWEGTNAGVKWFRCDENTEGLMDGERDKRLLCCYLWVRIKCYIIIIITMIS